jgi:hypothetical protein
MNRNEYARGMEMVPREMLRAARAVTTKELLGKSETETKAFVHGVASATQLVLQFEYLIPARTAAMLNTALAALFLAANENILEEDEPADVQNNQV